MASFKPLMPVLLVYGFGTLITIGHFYRTHEGRLGARQIACVFVWPLWWLLENGIGKTIDAISYATMGTEGRAAISLGIGLFSAGQFLFTHWETCSGVARCTGVVLKSSAMMCPPFGAAYLIWLVSQFG
ncbi:MULTISPECIES: hypothetical protein [unclassified Bradyrhizobium]|uniref:hypothetical protein n=1 Tax=unclassified Bradyrhizobium TaxID=2631580 RepID=UPI001FF9342F|nr:MULTISPECIES: hypothetical protein [unclassified Bradyrhizobium]MCK1422403.1 hypothetical protein [Bradyrhizobium sp. CW12]MCK1649051.1 hypothetical protein [Bradyrhizobium sp. 154]